MFISDTLKYDTRGEIQFAYLVYIMCIHTIISVIPVFGYLDVEY